MDDTGIEDFISDMHRRDGALGKRGRRRAKRAKRVINKVGIEVDPQVERAFASLDYSWHARTWATFALIPKILVGLALAFALLEGAGLARTIIR